MFTLSFARVANGRLLRLMLFLLLGASACKSERPGPAPASVPAPAPAAPGDLIFWNSQNAVTSNIQVTINGQGTKNIEYSVAAAPACGDSHGASFAGVPAGKYTYSATSAGFAAATGTVEVKSGACTAEQVTLVAANTGGGTGGTGNSTIMFWTDQNRGIITVKLAGQVAQITGINATMPPCGDPYSALFVSLTAGTYPFTASNTSGDTWSGNVTVAANQCFEDQLTYSTGGGGTGGGSAMFWSDQNLGAVDVTLNNRTVSFSGAYTSLPPCGASGAANFGGLAAGTYPYSASGGGRTWNGSIDIVANQCSTVRLYTNTPGGGGGGGNSTGTLTVWTASDHSCGNIVVTVNGATQNIANFYSSGTPGCGASGTATFTLAPGTYNVSGRCTNLTWSGTATVTAGGCFLLKLN